MKTPAVLLLIAILFGGVMAMAQPMDNPARVEIYVEPYYNSKGPVIKAGSYSSGLAANDDKIFAATIRKMKADWPQLPFPVMYVAAIRLYDLGYRDEAVYWFYSAQYRGRLFGAVVDRAKARGLGNPGFELMQAHQAFFQLSGPFINGYAFGDVDKLSTTLQRVQKESQVLPDFNGYGEVAYKDAGEWEAINKSINDGMDGLLEMLRKDRESIKKQRLESGLEQKFAPLKSREFPGRE